MKIYTKTGDEGATGLFAGPRVPKTHVRIEAFGDVDELNAVLGRARAAGLSPALDAVARQLQHDLFGLGAELATVQQHPSVPCFITDEKIAWVEATIDENEAALPTLKEFILPGGCQAAAELHVARTVCRRAERSVVRLHQESPIPPGILAYLNRIGDLLFVLARRANHLSGSVEERWKK